MTAVTTLSSENGVCRSGMKSIMHVHDIQVIAIRSCFYKSEFQQTLSVCVYALNNPEHVLSKPE